MEVKEYSVIRTESSKTELFAKQTISCQENIILDNPETVYKLMTNNANIQIDKRVVEYLYMLCLDNQSNLIGLCEIAIGTANTHVFSNRDIILNAALCGAASVILVHNHPSGDPEPSKADVKSTESAAKALKTCGMTLIDHVIIGSKCFYSINQDRYYAYDKTVLDINTEITEVEAVLNNSNQFEPEQIASAYERLFVLKHIKDLWNDFGDILIDPETETIEFDWRGFPKGTHREEIWHWFENEFGISVASLMYE